MYTVIYLLRLFVKLKCSIYNHIIYPIKQVLLRRKKVGITKRKK